MIFNNLKFYIKNKILVKPNRNYLKLLVFLVRSLSKSKEPDKWIFIAGCYNSGTTLLLRLLGLHPDISILNEGAARTEQLVTPEELGWTRMWCKVISKVRLTENNSNIDIKKLKKDWMVFFDKRKFVYVEKSIVNSARMRWFQKNFKNSYFIHIVRNGYAVAEGIRRKAPIGRWGISDKFDTTYPIELCAKQWVINNKIIEEDSKYIKNFKMVTYENLCYDPDKIIKDIFRFTNLEIPENFKINGYVKLNNKYKEIKNMNLKSFENLSANDIKNIENVAAPFLKYYKYNFL